MSASDELTCPLHGEFKESLRTLKEDVVPSLKEVDGEQWSAINTLREKQETILRNSMGAMVAGFVNFVAMLIIGLILYGIKGS